MCIRICRLRKDLEKYIEFYSKREEEYKAQMAISVKERELFDAAKEQYEGVIKSQAEKVCA